jgi:hypothetical protein
MHLFEKFFNQSYNLRLFFFFELIVKRKRRSRPLTDSVTGNWPSWPPMERPIGER